MTLELDPTTGRATALRHIVLMDDADGLFHFYPSWSPDEHWLVMAAAPRGTSAYAATTARLRLASADVDGQTCPGATCFDLAKASQGTAVSSTWPKLSPFSQSNDQLLFVTFSSKIDYGFALVNTGTSGARRAQLWMAAIDLRTAAAGGDPLAAAHLAALPGHHRDQPPAVLDRPRGLHPERHLLRELRRRGGLRQRRLQGRRAIVRTLTPSPPDHKDAPVAQLDRAAAF